MSDLQKYISRRKQSDQAFAEGFDAGYKKLHHEAQQQLQQTKPDQEKPTPPNPTA